MRRKTKSKRISLTRALLKLLSKFIDFEKELSEAYNIEFTSLYYKRINTIQKIYKQQKDHFDTGEKIKDRIVRYMKLAH